MEGLAVRDAKRFGSGRLRSIEPIAAIAVFLWQGARSKAPPRLRFGIPQDPHGAAPRAVSSIRWSRGGNVGVRLRIYERETVPWRDKRSSIASRSTSTHSALQRARASA